MRWNPPKDRRTGYEKRRRGSRAENIDAVPALARDPVRAASAGWPLETLLERGESLWRLMPDSFEGELRGSGFRWTSQDRMTVRAYRAPLVFLDRSVLEALAEFRDERLSSLTLVFYSRGDSGTLAYDEFLVRVQSLGTDLNRKTETTTPVVLKPTVTARGVRLQTYAWVWPPLTWGVMLGLVPEASALPHTSGGPLRLIIGYNASSDEVLYTDSWGRGHEGKRMSMDAAWSITLLLVSIEPRHLTL